ncbi:MAG: VCBS repeat-containing protein, partial [Parcubacteria group bacterium]
MELPINKKITWRGTKIIVIAIGLIALSFMGMLPVSTPLTPVKEAKAAVANYPLLDTALEMQANAYWSMTYGDFNGDGLVDYAAAGDEINIWLQTSEHFFEKLGAVPSTSGTRPQVLKAAQLNADTALDLVWTDNYGWDVEISTGNGDGTFDTPVSLDGSNRGTNLDIADFNNDGNKDIAMSCSYDDSVYIFLHDDLGTNGFAAPQIVALGGDYDPSDIVAIDADNDTDLDLMTANNNAAATHVSYLENTGTHSGSFSNPVVNVAVGVQQKTLVAGKFNSDDLTDIVVGVQGALRFLPNTSPSPGSFSFGPASSDYSTGGQMRENTVTGDVNGDGVLDIVTNDLATGNYPDGNGVVVMLNDGSGVFSNSGQSFALLLAWLSELVDMDQD